MKKAIVLLLALAVLGGAVFAQATVGGYVRAKAEFTETAVTWADRLRLNFSFVTEDKNAFFQGRFQGSNVDGLTNLSALFYYMYGGVQFADGMVKVTAGKINNYDYYIGSSGDDWYNGGVSNNGSMWESTNMVLAQVYPIDGLTLAVGYEPLNAAFNVGNFDFAASFAVPDLLKVVLDADFGADFDLAATRYSATVQVKAVKDLTANVGYKHSAADVAAVYGMFGYKAGALYAEVSPEFDLTNSALVGELWVKYMVSDMLAVAGFAKYRSAPAAGVDGVFGGATLYYTVSKKGSIQTGVTYGDVTGVKVPFVVKVTF